MLRKSSFLLLTIFIFSSCQFIDDLLNNNGDSVPEDVITVVYPNGGEELIGNDSIRISFRRADVIDTARAEYSIDAGESFHSIIDTLVHATVCDWRVPSERTDSALIKVSDVRDESVFDVSDQSQVKKMIESVHQQHGRIDVLINNAGIMIVKLFEDMTEDEYNKQMNVNLNGAVYCTRAVVPIMLQQRRGAIFNFGSPMAKTIVPGAASYIVSKAACYAFSEALYYELKDRGIHIGVILPGGTRTHLFDEAIFDKLGEFYRDHCTTTPEKIAVHIRKALEKERFETITQPSDRFLILFRNVFPRIFQTFAMIKLRKYLPSK